MHVKKCSVDEALAANLAMREQKDEVAWNRREYETLKMIKAHIIS